MHALLTTTKMEARMLVREPLMLFFGIAFPSILLTVLALVPALSEPDPNLGGVRFIDYFAPSVVVLTLAMIALQGVPNTLAAYREQGILRRLSVTPASPALVLIAQLTVNFVATLVSIVLVMTVGRLLFDIPLPRHMLGFAAAFLAGVTAVFALGLVIAAVARSARAASGMASVVYLVTIFFGGVMLPRFLLPDAVARIGVYIPPGVQALTDAWIGNAPPQASHVLIMAGIAVVAAAVAAKLFRWE